MILWSRITWKVSKTRTQKRKRNEMWKYLLEMFLRNEESNEQEVQNMEPADWINQAPGRLNSFCEMLRRRGSWAFKFNLSTYNYNKHSTTWKVLCTVFTHSLCSYQKSHLFDLWHVNNLCVNNCVIPALFMKYSPYDGYVMCKYKNDSLFCHFS